MAHKKGSSLEGIADAGSRVEYTSREFCREIFCPVQHELGKLEKGSEEYERAKLECENGCLYTMHEMVAWLAKNQYGLEGGTDSEPVHESYTAWEYHNLLKRRGVRIVKEVTDEKHRS